MIQKIDNIKKLPKEALIKAIINIFKRKLKNSYIRLYPITLSNKEFLNLNHYNTINELINREIPEFFFDPSNKKEIVNSLRNSDHKSIVNCILDADKICNHIFNLLGSGKTNLGNNIDWQTDFKSNYAWDSKKCYLGSSVYMDYYKLGLFADIKVPWELSRAQHFVTLGKAYWYTNNESYVQEFVDEITSWMDNNPIEIGVNWVCTMDVAIRAVNWIWGYYFFSDSVILTDKFKINFFKSLFLHGRYIIEHLEFESRNNHYLSNLVGLVYLGIFFHETLEGKNWLEKGLFGLQCEMELQVYSDGVNFEASIGYHRLATELFSSATILCMKNGIKFPEWYMRRLEKMFEFIYAYTKPDGSAPQIGDTDDGRLHILSNYGKWDKRDHRYLLPIGALLFNRYDFICNSQELNEDAFWLFGGNLVENEGMRLIKPIKGSLAFPEGGFYILRESDLYMIVDCLSPNKNFPQGHRHNSNLSFELFAYDKSFIVDPGSYIYTANKNMRNMFRSTKYHNVVQVDGEEQNSFNENEIFDMEANAQVKINEWKITEEYDFLDAEHDGYERLKKPVKHRRQIYFDKRKRYWLIRDILGANGKHQFDLYFHFAPMEIKFYADNQYIIRSNFQSGVNLVIIPLETNELSAEITDGWVSYSYGEKINSYVMKYSKYSKGPTTFVNLIYPFKSEEDLESIINDKEIFKNFLNF